MRDYVEWHKDYDDPASDLSWRLRMVQGYIARALAETSGPVRVVSLCSGDGRDILGVLSQRPGDLARVAVTLVEINPALAGRARSAAQALEITHCEVRELDAGVTSSLAGAVPADIVLLVGIFGNISNEDLERTVKYAPQLCNPGATVVWSRARQDGDVNDQVRQWFAEAGFAEVAYEAPDFGSKPAVGVCVYEGPAVTLSEGGRLFTFVR
ncbi:MAG TPA: hypothetical protein VFN61_12605 [Acidimicrobiales bacterium]|nr:hypothetical protein [Acidimicrobiales bacterium]